MTYLGWYQPDRKLTVDRKIAEALDRFQQKFGQKADTVLCSPHDAEGLLEPIDGVTIEARGYIANSTFYVGRQDGTEPVEVPS